eukprot:gene7147-254_t
MVRGASKRSTYFDGPRHVATKSMHVNTNSMHADTPHTEDSPNQPQPSNKPLKSGLKASPFKDTLAAIAVQRRVLFNPQEDASPSKDTLAAIAIQRAVLFNPQEVASPSKDTLAAMAVQRRALPSNDSLAAMAVQRRASPSKDTLAAMAVQRRVLFNTHVDISLVPEQLVTTPPQHWSADSIPATSQDHNTDSKTTETKAATLARRSTKPADLITNPSPPPLHQQSAPKPPVTSPPVPKPTRLPKPLGLVLSRLNLALTADQVEIYHDSQDPSDPSDLVFLRGTNLRYDTSFTFTPTVQTVVRSNRTYTTPGTQSAMSALSLEAYDLKLVKPHDDAAALAAVAVPAGGAASRRPPKAGHGKSQSWGAGNGVSSKVASEAKGMKLTRQETDKLVTDVDFGGGLIMSAACLLLKQGKPANLALSMRHRNVKAGLAAQDMSRPIRIVAQDLRFLCSAALRDTCIATFEHIIAAFRMPTPTRLAKLQQMHSNGLWREGSGLHQYSNPHTSMEDPPVDYRKLSSPPQGRGLPVDYRKVSPPPRGGVRSRQIEAQARELVRVEEEDIIRRIKMKKVQSQDPEGAAHNSDDENTVRGADSAGLDSFSEFTRFNPDGLTAAPVRVQRYEVEFVHVQMDRPTAAPVRVQRYVVEFDHVQVNFDPEDGGGSGRVLLSADSALLAGYPLSTSQKVNFNPEDGGGGGGVILSADSALLAGYPLSTSQQVITSFNMVNFDPEDGGGGGRVLLSADSALLAGYLLPTSQQVITSFNMEHIQAYTIRNEGGVNTCARPPWLQIQNGKICPQTAIASSHLRVQKVLDPFRLHVTSTRPQIQNGKICPLTAIASSHLRVQKVLDPFRLHVTSTRPHELGASVPDATTSCNQGSGGSLPGSPTDSPNTLPSLASMKQAPKRISSPSFNDVGNGDNGASITPQQTLSISVPTIIGELDSWQFEVLAEVITSIIARPPPQVKLLLHTEPSKPSVDSSPEVVAGVLPSKPSVDSSLEVVAGMVKLLLPREPSKPSVGSSPEVVAGMVKLLVSREPSKLSVDSSPEVVAGMVKLLLPREPSKPSVDSSPEVVAGMVRVQHMEEELRCLQHELCTVSVHSVDLQMAANVVPAKSSPHQSSVSFTGSPSAGFKEGVGLIFSSPSSSSTGPTMRGLPGTGLPPAPDRGLGMLMLQGPLARNSNEHQHMLGGSGAFGGGGASTSQRMLMLQGPLARSSTEHQQLYRGGGVFGGSGTSTSQSVYNALNSSGVQIVDEHGMLVALKHMSASLSPAQSQSQVAHHMSSYTDRGGSKGHRHRSMIVLRNQDIMLQWWHTTCPPTPTVEDPKGTGTAP